MRTGMMKLPRKRRCAAGTLRSVLTIMLLLASNKCPATIVSGAEPVQVDAWLEDQLALDRSKAAYVLSKLLAKLKAAGDYGSAIYDDCHLTSAVFDTYGSSKIYYKQASPERSLQCDLSSTSEQWCLMGQDKQMHILPPVSEPFAFTECLMLTASIPRYLSSVSRVRNMPSDHHLLHPSLP